MAPTTEEARPLKIQTPARAAAKSLAASIDREAASAALDANEQTPAAFVNALIRELLRVENATTRPRAKREQALGRKGLI